MPSPLDSLDPFNLKQQVSRLDDVRALGDPVRLEHRRGPHRAARAAAAAARRPPGEDADQDLPAVQGAADPVAAQQEGRAAAVGRQRRVRRRRSASRARWRRPGIEPQAISVCSGSALWGSMMASGLSAQEMVNQSLNWQPEDYLDIQWTRLPRFAMAAMRGFTGLAKGEAIEKLFDRQLWHMTLGESPIPIYSEVYNIDLNRLETFGSKLTPDLTIAELVRIAIALPLLVESVRVDGHLYADGGVVDVFPAEPLLEHERLDVVVGVNTILPRGFEGEDISGWTERTMGFMTASRQISYAGHLELARRSARRLGRKLILIDPVDFTEVHGWRFYDLFIDRRKWPRLILQGYEHATRVLDRYRRSSGARKRSRPHGRRRAVVAPAQNDTANASVLLSACSMMHGQSELVFSNSIASATPRMNSGTNLSGCEVDGAEDQRRCRARPAPSPSCCAAPGTGSRGRRTPPRTAPRRSRRPRSRSPAATLSSAPSCSGRSSVGGLTSTV